LTDRCGPRTAWAAAALLLWAGLIVLPLVGLYGGADGDEPGAGASVPVGVTVRSFALAAALAAGSVVLGYLPGRLLGTARRGRAALWVVLLAPLLLPRYLLLYAWDLVRSPMTPLGDVLSRRADLARAAGAVTSSLVLVLWYWPLAALLIGQGWQALDRDVDRSARLDAGAGGRVLGVTLPLLAPALGLAFGVCFVLVLSEFATFHLAGIETFGTELAVLYAETGSAQVVARSAWPAAIPAAIVAVLLWRRAADWSTRPPIAPPDPPRHAGRSWLVVAALLALTVAAPVALLATAVREVRPFGDFYALHREELGTSFLAAGAGAAVAVTIAAGALVLDGLGRAGKALAWLVVPTVLLAALLPGSLVGAALVRVQVELRAVGFHEGWWSVSAGLASRFAGIALILLHFGRYGRSRHLAEMAATDGASWSRTWRHVHLPLLWPLPVGAFVLVMMLGLIELPATMVLLPAGVPNFAQSLLNQMHYARDQQVIATCLVLVGAYAVVGAGALTVRGLVRRLARPAAATLLVGLVLAAAGCESGPAGEPEVLAAFGKTGRGPGEFVYPRAIDRGRDGTLWVADKTGRIQHFDRDGKWLGGFAMPKVEAGKPTGLTVGPDGNLYVADTHYHRVMIFSPAGEALRQFGRYGTRDGCFIYPTDVAFGPDGRIFVSEYGGNDRVSVFTPKGRFLKSFGSFGGDAGQFARPSAVQVDAKRGRL
jgi:ABC-type Fe3+ transport system permease subunit/streptogramin lyase